MSGNRMGCERQDNNRTALVLAGVALAFFLAIVFNYWLAK
jgi:hypothetical protein